MGTAGSITITIKHRIRQYKAELVDGHNIDDRSYL